MPADGTTSPTSFGEAVARLNDNEPAHFINGVRVELHAGASIERQLRADMAKLLDVLRQEPGFERSRIPCDVTQCFGRHDGD